METSTWFITVFVLVWLAGSTTQILFLVAPKLHHKLGLTEAKALEPDFRWFILDEKAIAYADITHAISGLAFIVLALSGDRTALIFGLYSCACYVYISCLAVSRWLMLGKEGISPLDPKQHSFYFSYMGLLLLFGLYGLYYLWGLA